MFAKVDSFHQFSTAVVYTNLLVVRHNSKVAIGSDTDTVSSGNIQNYLRRGNFGVIWDTRHPLIVAIAGKGLCGYADYRDNSHHQQGEEFHTYIYSDYCN